MSEPHTEKICPKRYVSIRRSSVRQDLHMCMVDADYAISIMVVFFQASDRKGVEKVCANAQADLCLPVNVDHI